MHHHTQNASSSCSLSFQNDSFHDMFKLPFAFGCQKVTKHLPALLGMWCDGGVVRGVSASLLSGLEELQLVGNGSVRGICGIERLSRCP
eukprot:388320-Amphidinium_carterae.1